jgi:hypothetical protein
MVQTGLLMESLEMVCRWSHLELDTVPGGHDALLVVVICFFVVIIGDGYSWNPLRVLLSPLLATLGILLCVLDGDAGWHCLAIAGDHFPAVWNRERPDRLLIDGVLDGDIEQFLVGVADDVVQWSEK